MSPERLHIALLVPRLPPAPDGIGDYTACLGRTLATQFGCKVTLFSGSGNFDCPEGCDLDTAAYAPGAEILRSLPRALEQHRPDWLIVQYNPFLYAHRGFNPWLVAAIRRCRSLSALKVAIMGHELHMFPDDFKSALMGSYQKIQAEQLFKASHVAFASIETWTRIIRKWVPDQPTIHLPVGSNILPVPLDNLHRQNLKAQLDLPADAVLLGAFGSSHPGKMQALILDTLAQLRRQDLPAYLLGIGSGSASMQQICPESLMPYLRTTGFLTVPEVSRTLQTLDILLSPFADGISTRRTSAIAGFAHDLPVLSTSGKFTDGLWLAEFADYLPPVDNTDAFVQMAADLCKSVERRKAFAQAGRALYERHFTWEVIGRRLLSALESSTGANALLAGSR